MDAGDLMEGEGMALINGSPCATALAADVTLHAGHRLRLAEAIFALSIEALAAPLEAYDEALDDLRGDEAERTVLHRLRGNLRGAASSGRLAAPTLLPATVNDTQNDIATPTFGAYRSQHRAAECLDGVLAILALVSAGPP